MRCLRVSCRSLDWVRGAANVAVSRMQNMQQKVRPKPASPSPTRTLARVSLPEALNCCVI